MRVLQYSTPHGITVTRTMSKVSYRKGLRSLLRELDTCRGIYLSSGYEFPGRYSRWDIASTRPRRGVPAAQYARRDPQPDACPGAARSSSLGFVRPPKRRRAGRDSQASPEIVSRGRAQQAAVGFFDSPRADSRVPQRAGFAPRARGRLRIRP